MGNKGLYETPVIEYWGCEELDAIEATMSGGSGSGGVVVVTKTRFASTLFLKFALSSNSANIISTAWDRIEEYYSSESMVMRSWRLSRFLGELVYDNRAEFWDAFAGVLFAGDSYGESFCTLGLRLGQYYETLKTAVGQAGNGAIIDFPHMMITIASALASDVGVNTSAADAITQTYCGVVPELSQQALREGVTGWLGDCILDGGKWGSGDFNADLDAVNIVSIVRSGYSLPEAINRYYERYESDRKSLFLDNVGLDVEQLEDVILRTLGVYDPALTQSDKDSLVRENYPDTYDVFIEKLR